MSWARHWSIASLCATWLFAGGCASPGPSPFNYGVRHVQDGDAAAVFWTAHATLGNLGYRIGPADPAAGEIITQPTATTPDAERAHVGTRAASRSRLRRVVHVRVARSADAVNVYCQVAIQEQTTEAHRMFRRNHMISDTPGETPIDREAATTDEQNMVWQTIARDKAAERRILEAILERTGDVGG
jgi:glyoxylate carboligase